MLYITLLMHEFWFVLLLFNRFMSIGGWNILNRWLVEAKKNENFPVLVELLEVIKDEEYFDYLKCNAVQCGIT